MTVIDSPPVTFGRLLGAGPGLDAHLRGHGLMPRPGPGLIRLATDADLRGRGGAGFPTARKLAAVAGAGRGAKVVVANGTEGEPMSAKDRALLTSSPHLVLDGLDAAAAAVGAHRRIVAIERSHADVEAALRRAIAERRDRSTEVVRTPRRYVSGQESALVDLINGGPGRPTLDRPFERGVDGRPTLVDNVETLASLALIARHGHGAATTTLVTVGGAVTRPGVYEVAIGKPLSTLLRQAGVRSPRAVLFGGYFGRWVPAAALRGVCIERDSLATVGATLGAGVLAVVDDDACAVAEMARVAAWFAANSAGQCGACTWGLRDLATASAAVHLGTPDPRAPADIRRWAAMVRGRGACKLPDGAAEFLESGYDVFAEEVAAHQAGGCRRIDHGLLPVPKPEAFA